MNSKPFTMPHPDAYKDVEKALYEYYWLCFPDYDEGDLYDLVRGPLVEIEDTVRRLYKVKEEPGYIGSVTWKGWKVDLVVDDDED